MCVCVTEYVIVRDSLGDRAIGTYTVEECVTLP